MTRKKRSFLDRLFGRGKSKRKEDAASLPTSFPPLARLLTKGEKLGGGEIGCVFDGPVLREMSRKEPSAPLKPNEVRWGIPTKMFEVTVSLPVQNGDVVESNVRLIFEPEMNLGKLLERREKITNSDVIELAVSEFSAVLRGQNLAPETLPQLDADALELLRGRFSVALGQTGFRCEEICGFRLKKPPVSSDPEPFPVINHKNDVKEKESDSMPTSSNFEKTRESFIQFLRSAESGTPEKTDTLAELAENLISAGMNSAESTQSIAAALRASDNAGAAGPDLSYWKGLLGRLDRVAAETESSVGETSAGETESSAGETNAGDFPTVTPATFDLGKRPAFKMLRDPKAFEARLRIFLYRKVFASQQMIAVLKCRTKSIDEMVFLRELDDEISRLCGRMEGVSKRSFVERRVLVDSSVMIEFFRESDRAIAAAERLETQFMAGMSSVTENRGPILADLTELTGWVNRIMYD